MGKILVALHVQFLELDMLLDHFKIDLDFTKIATWYLAMSSNIRAMSRTNIRANVTAPQGAPYFVIL